MFDNLKNMGSLMDLMRNAGQVQERIKGVHENLAKRTVSADAAAGAVVATVNGRLELVKLTIDKTRVNAADLELLEDLIVSAVRAAQDKAGDMMKEEMQKAATDLGLPPGMMP